MKTQKSFVGLFAFRNAQNGVEYGIRTSNNFVELTAEIQYQVKTGGRGNNGDPAIFGIIWPEKITVITNE
jgi:hypothetical protein